MTLPSLLKHAKVWIITPPQLVIRVVQGSSQRGSQAGDDTADESESERSKTNKAGCEFHDRTKSVSGHLLQNAPCSWTSKGHLTISERCGSSGVRRNQSYSYVEVHSEHHFRLIPADKARPLITHSESQTKSQNEKPDKGGELYWLQYFCWIQRNAFVDSSRYTSAADWRMVFVTED